MPFCKEPIVSTWDLDTFEGHLTRTRSFKTIVSTWDLDAFEDPHQRHQIAVPIVSTWDLDTFEDRNDREEVTPNHCINLGSERLRRSFLTPEGEALDCINLGSG